MAVTYAVTNFKRGNFGDLRVVYGTLTATGTYTTGGDAISPTTLNLHSIQELDLGPALNGTNCFPVRWNRANGTVQFFGVGAAGAANPSPELTAGTSVSSYFIEFMAIGE